MGQVIAFILPKRAEKLTVCPTLRDWLYEPKRCLEQGEANERVRYLSGHFVVRKPNLTSKLAINHGFHPFWMPKAAPSRKSVVGGGIKQNDVVDPEREATWLVLEHEALDSKCIQSFAIASQRVDKKQPILSSNPVPNE